MKYILFLTVLISFNQVNGQNNMIITDVQSEITNKKWTLQLSNPKALTWYFKGDVVGLNIGGRDISETPYYFAEFDEVQNTRFSPSNVGRLSSGKYIVSPTQIFEIEIYNDLKSFRMKRIWEDESEWQRYYLMED